MKSKEELEVLKKEYEDLSKKMSKLTDEEMEQIVGAGRGRGEKYERKCKVCGKTFISDFPPGSLSPFRVFCKECLRNPELRLKIKEILNEELKKGIPIF